MAGKPNYFIFWLLTCSFEASVLTPSPKPNGPPTFPGGSLGGYSAVLFSRMSGHQYRVVYRNPTSDKQSFGSEIFAYFKGIFSAFLQQIFAVRISPYSGISGNVSGVSSVFHEKEEIVIIPCT